MSGLDDVIAAETTLSEVDGANGRLIICGRSLDELSNTASYEDVLMLLLGERLGFTRATLSAALGNARDQAFDELAHLDDALTDLSITEGLRALMARLPDGEGAETALRFIAAPAVFVPALIRRKMGLKPLAANPQAGHAQDMIAMLKGREDSALAQALDTYLVTVSDHGLNASTFAARVVASTRAGYGSAVLAALSALKGPLHGGAPGPVLDMLDSVGQPEHAANWIRSELARGSRLMGFGHRIYRVRDPRADALKAALHRLGATGNMDHERIALAEVVEKEALEQLRAAKPDRALDTNVEYFTALLLDAVGFPRDAFTGVFAAGRVGGWVAHAREQIDTGRLIRPQSRYVGPKAA